MFLSNKTFTDYFALPVFTHFSFLLYSIYRESTGIGKIFDMRFLMDLQVLEYSQDDLTIFSKYLSIFRSVGLSECETNVVEVLEQKLMDGIA